MKCLKCEELDEIHKKEEIITHMGQYNCVISILITPYNDTLPPVEHKFPTF